LRPFDQAKPGIEEARVTGEATEVRYFAPSNISWQEIAVVTTRDALRNWLRLAASE
jgi:hypothetical protein